MDESKLSPNYLIPSWPLVLTCPANLIHAAAHLAPIGYLALASHGLESGQMDSGSTEVLVDAGSFRLYNDGHVERLDGVDHVPAGFDADTGVTSKDVVIDAVTGVAARLYLPDIQAAAGRSDGTAITKLPIVVFFHGGYFIVGSAGSPRYHRYVNSLAARARAIAVSVDYRLAPEHPLPAAYDDSWLTLNWAASGSADPWLSEHGDLGRVFLAGLSAGGNIAHNMAIDAGLTGLRAPARIEGAILLHPSFCGEQRMEAEAEEHWASVKKRWAVICPGARGGLDDPRMNPTAAGAPSLAALACERMLVTAASEDPRMPRDRAYYEAVVSSGWGGSVEWFVSEGEGHGFFIDEPGGSEAAALMERVVGFVTRH